MSVAALSASFAVTPAATATPSNSLEDEAPIVLSPIALGNDAEEGLTFYETLVSEPSTEVSVEYELPEECSVQGRPSEDNGKIKLICSEKVEEFSPVILGSDGNSIPWSLSTSNKGLRVTFTSGQAETLATGVISSHSEKIIEEALNAIDVSNEDWSGALSYTFDKSKFSGFAPTPIQPVLHSTSPKVITVPSTYKYCPSTCKPKSLHDYCTWSPDSWFKANFRGPCAIHDMRIDSTRKKSISLKQKRDERKKHDAQFGKNLRTNCSYYYPRKIVDAASRKTCHAVTFVYQGAVSAKTMIWNGK